MTWVERAAERSPGVQRSRLRSATQARAIVDAARRLMIEKGDNFTTQELVKEAGVALQTFYRYFGGKDQLLLAVIEDIIAGSVALYAERAQELAGPVERLHFYVTTAVSGVEPGAPDGIPARFVTNEHWRLKRLFPEEVSRATQPFADLLVPEIRAAGEAGLLNPADPERDAWFITQLVMAVFHHYAYTSPKDTNVGEDLWRFCLTALGGTQR